MPFLSNLDEANAFIIADKLRENIALEPKKKIGITISIGPAIRDINKKINFESMKNVSDRALYQSKETGRNKTTIVKC